LNLPPWTAWRNVILPQAIPAERILSAPREQRTRMFLKAVIERE